MFSLIWCKDILQCC